MAHKYKVSPPDERKYNGRTYGSKSEMRYAMHLDRLLEQDVVLDYVCQPKTWLGVPENVYVPDFLIIPHGGPAYYVDVKGMETAKFKRDKKLWKAYGRLGLHVVKAKGQKFYVSEVIDAARS